MQRIAVIDYGMGNLRSVAKAIEHVVPKDVEVQITHDQQVITDSDHVVCPGQGAAKDCMEQLRLQQMDKAVLSAIEQGTPFLGICMGLQVMLGHSEENSGIDCLDIIPGNVKAFDLDMTEAGERLKIPHMGWNRVTHTQAHPIWDEIPDESRFYFCHSYYVVPEDPMVVAGKCHHGIEFSTALARDNIFACQFHPEKSAEVGLQLLHNFSRWNGKSE